jgi:Domain of unknown function (DUF4268)
LLFGTQNWIFCRALWTAGFIFFGLRLDGCADAVLKRQDWGMEPSASASSEPQVSLGRLEQVDPRSVWRHEALNFTPWLLENADRLGEALGVELELTRAEHPVGGYSLDLIGRDMTNGTVVIVENQLADSDHSHLGQLLTYAAGTSASTIVWLTTSFRDEHRQAMTWLNEHTDEDTHFFGVELQVVRIGESERAPLFRVVAEPNDWQKAVKRSASNTTGGRAALYADFWERYLARVRAEHPDWTVPGRSPQNWLWMAAPIRACGLSSSFAAGGKIRHELYIDAQSAERSSARYEALARQKDALEAAYGRALTWELLPGRRACRIAEYRDGSITRADEHDAYMDFFLDAGQRMRNALVAIQLPD